jgi:hypothetical protein
MADGNNFRTKAKTETFARQSKTFDQNPTMKDDIKKPHA